jgi:hypothetical protein
VAVSLGPCAGLHHAGLKIEFQVGRIKTALQLTTALPVALDGTFDLIVDTLHVFQHFVKNLNYQWHWIILRVKVCNIAQ